MTKSDKDYENSSSSSSSEDDDDVFKSICDPQFSFKDTKQNIKKKKSEVLFKKTSGDQELDIIINNIFNNVEKAGKNSFEIFSQCKFTSEYLSTTKFI